MNALMGILETYKDVSGRAWASVWITYHGGVDRSTSNTFHSRTYHSKYPVKVSMRFLLNNRRALINRASLSKWDDTGTPQSKPFNFNAQFYSMSPQRMLIFLEDHFRVTSNLFNPRIRFGMIICNPDCRHARPYLLCTTHTLWKWNS